MRNRPKSLPLPSAAGLSCLLPAFPVHAWAAAPLNYLRASGSKADAVLPLTWATLIISIAVTVIIGLLVAGAIWRRPGIPSGMAPQKLDVERPRGGMSWLWIGVSISTVVLVFTVIWTMRVLAEISSPGSKPALTIEVTGHQWWWQIKYLDRDPAKVFQTANEIHIPVGKPVRVRLKGADVIHSFWVPALAGKTDAIPGVTNETWIEAKAPGTYQGQCTEYCGLEHARMGFLVIADRPADFEAWRAHQLETPPQPASAELAQEQAEFTTHCGGCHAVRGTDAAGVLGPDLSHLMGRKTIAAAMLPNTPTNLAKWIADPQSIKPGNLMQKPEVSARELADIRAYVSTLN